MKTLKQVRAEVKKLEDAQKPYTEPVGDIRLIDHRVIRWLVDETKALFYLGRSKN